MNIIKVSLLKYFVLLLIVSLFSSCSSKNDSGSYDKSPLDIVIRDLSNEMNYSIILHDMDYDDAGKTYKHQYNILIEKSDTVITKITEWYTVSPTFFDTHKENMGMEIVSKKNWKLNKTASPPGYSNYIGNEKYGHWVKRDGNSFWEFYGRYAFMSSMFRMSTFPVRYSYWNDYNRNYYNHGRPYYGTDAYGRSMYGTRSSYSNSNTSSKWNSKPSSFKNRVRQNVSKSSSSNKSSVKNKRSRTSSRYSRSSTRSRGGGFGK